jgi:hypothetical protein
VVGEAYEGPLPNHPKHKSHLASRAAQASALESGVPEEAQSSTGQQATPPAAAEAAQEDLQMPTLSNLITPSSPAPARPVVRTTPEQRAALLRLHEAATPVPWEPSTYQYPIDHSGTVFEDAHTVVIKRGPLPHGRALLDCMDFTRADVELVAGLRNTIPDLLADVDALSEANRRLRQYVQHKSNCAVNRRKGSYTDTGWLPDPGPCTCGLDAILATNPAQPPAVEGEQ